VEFSLPIVALMAFATLAFGCAGVATGLAWALLRAAREPKEGLATAIARLEAERAKDRLDMAAYIEEAAGIGESIKRHRSRIDGAEGAALKREQKRAEQEQQQPQLPAMSELDQVRARARAIGKL
jgi:hypothetical protein